jgi:hypothetical protein
MSIGRPRNTRMCLLRRAGLSVAIVPGLLLSVAAISVAASQVQNSPLGAEPSRRGSDNLNQKLDNSNGVISPREQVDPGMMVKPPNDTGSMRIIPPPGSPGRDPKVQPK